MIQLSTLSTVHSLILILYYIHSVATQSRQDCLLHQSRTRRGSRVEQSRKQVLPPIRAIGIVARPRRGVHRQVTCETGVGAAAVDPCAGSGGLQRRVLVALVEPVAERVGHRAGDHAGDVDHHAVRADVAARRHERRRLGTVQRPVERPRALPGALRGGVADPDVRGPGGPGVGAVQAAAARAEPVHAHVLRGEHQRDPALPRPGPRRQLRELGQRQALPQRAPFVGGLADERHPRAAAAAAAAPAPRLGEVQLVDGAPPLRHGRGRCQRRGGGGGEGPEEVGDHGLLRWREAAVPDYGHRDAALQHGAVVVRQDRAGRRLVQLQQAPAARGETCRAQDQHGHQRKCDVARALPAAKATMR
uniref:Uncharacterized protein n=1 Tax=Zea mays TaxID=4577 RepID=C4J1K8_MAIZE|nr:unknown [Zea mays]